MAIDSYITLTQATKLFNRRPHTSTLWRWCRRGVHGIKLPYIRQGKRILVSPDDVERFCRKLAEADADQDAHDHDVSRRVANGRSSPKRTDKQAAADRARAAAALDKAGI